MENDLPKSFEEDIIGYLKNQEIFAEDDIFPSFSLQDQLSPEQEISNVLEEILNRVCKRIFCRDRYENIRLEHNQYPLFDLSHIIPDFCMDEDTMEQLTFRESVLISEIDSLSSSREVEPKSVGGLCLSVQFVDGFIPEEREMPVEEKIHQEYKSLRKSANEFKKNLESINQKSGWNTFLKEKLKNYETLLKNQMQVNNKKFLVHLSSQFSVGNSNAGSRLTSWVDASLHTLEERRCEYIGDPFVEKSLYVGLQKDKYYVHHQTNGYDEKKYYSLRKTRDLLCEGASFILMRYLALTKYTGIFELSTIYINGDICRNIYECVGSTTGIINDKEVEICKIYRYVVEECGIEHHCVTVLTVNGYIISQEWEGCNYILNRNPVLFLGESHLPYEKRILTKTWLEDIELLSKYLDYKTEAELKMKTYLYDHPEVNELFSDYVNNILLLKPEHVLPFTMDYFQSFCPLKLPRQGYFNVHDDTAV